MGNHIKSLVQGVLSGIVLVFLAWLLVSMLYTQGCRREMSHYKSNWLGLNREVRLYSANGNVIASWSGNLSVEDKGGSVRFVLPDGRAIMLSGTYVIEEK